MKKENLRIANTLDYKIREIEKAIKKYKSNMEDEKPLSIPGIPTQIDLSLTATRKVVDIIISDLEIQQALLEKEFEDLN